MSEAKQSKSKLKILLVNLPWQRNGKFGVRAGSRWPHMRDEQENHYLPFPFFLSYATSLLQKYDIDAFLVDAVAEQISEDKLLEKVLSKNIDYLVAETSVPSFYDDLSILKKISSAGIPIILCGPNSEIYQPQFLEDHSFISYVLYGEYEFSLLELARSLQEGRDLSFIKGLIYRDGGSIIKNPKREPFDINLLPWPHREGLPMHRYLDTPGGMLTPSVQMMASRGCPYQCSFCLWPQVVYQGSHYRFRNVKDVADEAEHLVKEKGFKSVYFDDDTFNIGKERMLNICKEFKNRGLNKIQWAIMAKADLMEEVILEKMKEAGLYAVKYGIESASQELINRCGKYLDLKKAEKMIFYTKSLGIKVHLTFAFGLPGETKETIKKTMEYAFKLDPHSVQFSIVTPFPGTDLFEELDKQGRILTHEWSKYDGHYSCVFKPENISVKDLERAKRLAYRVWVGHQIRKRGLLGYLKRFKSYSKENGFGFALNKTFNFLKFADLRRGWYINVKLKLKKIRRVSLNIPKLVDYIITGKLFNDYRIILGIFTREHAFCGPLFVQIDLTNNCNNNCIACWCNSPLLEKEKKKDTREHAQTLPYKKVIELIDEFHKMGTRQLFYAGGGEPFMHPHIIDILAYSKKKGFECHVNTNFTMLDEKIINKIIDLKLNSLTVSVWAGTPQVYTVTHPNKSEEVFYKIKENLKLLNYKKRKLPVVKLYNVIFNLNYHELEQMIELALLTNSELIEFTVIDTITGKTDKLLLKDNERKALFNECIRLKEKYSQPDFVNRIKILNFDQFMRRISNIDAQSAEYDSDVIGTMPCYVGWVFSRILADGNVNSCLKSHRFPLGSIHNHKFSKIWNDKLQYYFREKTIRFNKNDVFFNLIGNDQNSKVGCYKSCDNIRHNIYMHKKITSLSRFEKNFLKKATNVIGFLKFNRTE